MSDVYGQEIREKEKKKQEKKENGKGIKKKRYKIYVYLLRVQRSYQTLDES